MDPKIETIPPLDRPNVNELDDLNFRISKKKQNQTKEKILVSTTTIAPTVATSTNPLKNANESLSEEESWVAGSGDSVIFLLDMHPDLGDPIEQLGIEIEEDFDDKVTGFVERFDEKLLWEKGVNVTMLEEDDLRCGGIVLRHNITTSEERLKELAEDCMVQKCKFISGGPERCPPDYRERR